MDFHDYILDYPLSNDENLQVDISSRREFYELKGNRKERVPEKGDFFNHQKLFTRYLTIYDRIFNIHETGTGKTGSIINAAETFKRSKIGIKKTVIILPGSATLEDFRSQIIKFFPEDYYDPNPTLAKKKIDKWYSLETYQAFSTRVNNMNDEYIEQIFSDTLFFLDEAHRMRNYGENKTDDNIYDYLWRLLHIAKRIKIVVASATPLVNSPNDFVPLVNLLLDENNQLPVTWDYTKVTIKQLEPYLRDKITFVRRLETGVNVRNRGNNIKITYPLIIPDESSNSLDIEPVMKKIVDKKIVSSEEPVQNQVDYFDQYIEFRSKLTLLPMTTMSKRKTPQYNSYVYSLTTNSSFNLNERESSVFVYPDGSWGKSGFNKYIIAAKDRFTNNLVYTFNKKVIDNVGQSEKSLPEYLNKNLDSLFNYSNKFWFYISNELKLTGNSFCYLEFVKGSGVILLDILMQYYGIEKFNISGTVNMNSLTKKKRFAIITADTTNLRTIMEVFNSDENKDGEYIQCILASQVARDGINLSNVVRGYIMTPTWHESGSHQALSRFIRATSHQRLLERDGKVDIDIYRLCSCTDIDYIKSESFTMESLRDLSNYSIDVKNYLNSEIKDIDNKRLMRKFKLMAFDGVLNYNRNFDRPTDNDYSKELDYDVKNPYMISNVDIRDIVDIKENTKLLMYNDSNLNTINNFVKEELSKNGVITLDYIKDFIKTRFSHIYMYFYIDKLEEILDMRDKFNNKIDVTYQGNVIYTKGYKDYNYNMNVTNFLPMVIKTDRQLDKTEVSELRLKLMNKNLNDAKKVIREYIWVTDNKENGIASEIEKRYVILRELLEQSIINVKLKEITDLDKTVFDIFSDYIGRVDYPYEDVQNVKRAFESESTNVGKKPTKTSETKLKGLKVNKRKDTNKNTVFYHWFDNTSTSKVTNIYTIRNNMRILENDEFRDTKIEEKYIFSKYMDEDRVRIFSKFLSGRNFGSIMRDNKFRLHIFKGKLGSISTDPLVELPLGTVCSKQKQEVIIDFLIDSLNAEADKTIIYKLFDRPKELIQNLKNNTAKKFITFDLNYKTNFLCGLIQKVMREKDLLFDGI